MTANHSAGNTIREIIEATGCSRGTVYKWIKSGKLTAHKVKGRYVIPFGANDNFIVENIKKKYSRPEEAWVPESIESYNEWHQLLDYYCWLIKICYSSKKDIKRKCFRIDKIFANYLKFHNVSLNKVRQIFATNTSPNINLISDDLKRGWYNELSYIIPLKESTLGLSFRDVSMNLDSSSTRFTFPSWRIVPAYYSIYFYLRSITLQKINTFRLQEHGATINVFKSSLFYMLSQIIWKYPLDICYNPHKRLYRNKLLINILPHTKYDYTAHPRTPHYTPFQINEYIYKTFKKRCKIHSKANTYMVFDYLHDFRVWANYLDIDNLLSLWGSGYKAFIDMNLSLLLFLIGGISEICYISVFGAKEFMDRVQGFYNTVVKNNPSIKLSIRNTSMYQRLRIYNIFNFLKGDIILKSGEDINAIAADIV
jgi:excisionase family DNA binding protein